MSTSLMEPTAEEQILMAQRDRLLRLLAAQRRHALWLFDWYHGRQPDPVVPGRYREGYKLLLELARTPWARLVVDTIAERLHVQGFRSPEGVQSEEQAWRLFEASALNADEWLVYTEALITGAGYLSVSSADQEVARITPESVFEVTHEPEPGDRRAVAAALKLYPLDWEGRGWQVELYRPEATFRWLTELPATSSSRLEPHQAPIDLDERQRAEIQWEEAEPFTVPNPLLAVPVVPFENRATIIGGGVSELEDCIPILRRIDKLILDKMLAAEFASFRQKWATGLEVPEDPETGQKVEPFKAAVDRLWVNTSADGRFGTFEASDLGQYLTAIDSEIAALAAISRVPAHYLLQQNLANPPSAESLVAAESGLVAKVRERQRRFGESWERSLRLAFALEEGRVADGPSLEVVWADAEMRNPAQVADAAVKLQTIGVPQRALWEYVGATPQQLTEWTVEAAAEELAAPPAVTGPPGS
jgi:Phage portal protein, SPP1 Gp6-like